MVRAFSTELVDDTVLDQLLDDARRGPSAGNTQALEFLLLTGKDECDAYWATTFSDAGRAAFRWQQLLDAPALVIIAIRPESYRERYAETDKARPGLGEATEAWPVPFWWVDAGAVAQNLLLLANEHGLGACLFGIFDHEAAVKAHFNVPDDFRLVATIALGHPLPDEPGRSAGRRRNALDHVVHRGRWA